MIAEALIVATIGQAAVPGPAQGAIAPPQAVATDGAPAQGPALSLGSKAPMPEIEFVVRGDRPRFFEPGRVYVIEFWATWCGPCRKSMPHLTRIAEEFADRGVTVVGISDEDEPTVRAFLEKDEWRQKARYVLCADPDRSTHRAYMEAAGQQGIPTAFLVKEGTVQWIGHPSQLDGPLAKVLDGTWDWKAAKATFDDAMAEERAGLAKRTAMAAAMEGRDWDRALAMLDAEVAAAPPGEAQEWRAQKAQVLLLAGRGDAAYALCAEVVKADPGMRAWLAASVLRMPDVPDRRPDVAIGWLEALAREGGQPQPQVLSELAYAWTLKGDRAKALGFARQALDAARGLGPSAADWVAELAAQVRELEAQDAAPAGAGAGAGDAAPAR